MTEPPPREGKASKSPVTYCELTLPSMTKFFPVNFPERVRGSVFDENFTPLVCKVSTSSPMGRAESRSVPENVVSVPNAAETESKKRSVEPLAPTYKSAFSLGEEMGVTTAPKSFFSIFAPRETRQEEV